MARVRLPSLTLQEMKDLRRCVEHLMAAGAVLSRSAWNSAPLVKSVVDETIMVIGPLYDRAEPAYLRIVGAAAADPAQEAAGELEAVEDPAQGPGTRQEEEED